MKKFLLILSLAIATKTFTLAERITPAEKNIIAKELRGTSKTQPVNVYEAIVDAKAYLRPSLKSARIAEQTIKKGDTVLEECGATSFRPYKTNWYQWEWRADECFYLKKDFKKSTYNCIDQIVTCKQKKLVFANKNGDQITISRLDKNGHKLRDAYDENGDSYDGDIYIVNHFSDSPDILEVADGKISLSGMSRWFSRDPENQEDKEGVVVDGKLTCDGFVFTFGDPDFYVQLKYVPSKNAILSGGDLYYLVESE
ncbi:MAG: hypothetical protein MJZ63_04990 [Muribaculaceae bacterium]|nr:hypothetical protein [Muribaculaceae bacterium]